MIINGDEDLIKQNLHEEFENAIEFLIEVEIIQLSRYDKDFITGQSQLLFHGTVSLFICSLNIVCIIAVSIAGHAQVVVGNDAHQTPQ